MMPPLAWREDLLVPLSELLFLSCDIITITFLQKPLLSPKVCDDEIYFFKKPITPQKVMYFPLDLSFRNIESGF